MTTPRLVGYRPMTIKSKLFTNLVDALGKVAGGLKAIVNLPEAERETMRQSLDETYRLIDTTLNRVIIRLGNLQLLAVGNDLLCEAARFDNDGDRLQAVQAARLCHGKGAQS
jgi:hypothetical protein